MVNIPLLGRLSAPSAAKMRRLRRAAPGNRPICLVFGAICRGFTHPRAPRGRPRPPPFGVSPTLGRLSGFHPPSGRRVFGVSPTPFGLRLSGFHPPGRRSGQSRRIRPRLRGFTHPWACGQRRGNSHSGVGGSPAAGSGEQPPSDGGSPAQSFRRGLISPGISTPFGRLTDLTLSIIISLTARPSAPPWAKGQKGGP